MITKKLEVNIQIKTDRQKLFLSTLAHQEMHLKSYQVIFTLQIQLTNRPYLIRNPDKATYQLGTFKLRHYPYFILIDAVLIYSYRIEQIPIMLARFTVQWRKHLIPQH